MKRTQIPKALWEQLKILGLPPNIAVASMGLMGISGLEYQNPYASGFVCFISLLLIGFHKRDEHILKKAGIWLNTKSTYCAYSPDTSNKTAKLSEVINYNDFDDNGQAIIHRDGTLTTPFLVWAQDLESADDREKTVQKILSHRAAKTLANEATASIKITLQADILRQRLSPDDHSHFSNQVVFSVSTSPVPKKQKLWQHANRFLAKEDIPEANSQININHHGVIVSRFMDQLRNSGFKIKRFSKIEQANFLRSTISFGCKKIETIDSSKPLSSQLVDQDIDTDKGMIGDRYFRILTLGSVTADSKPDFFRHILELPFESKVTIKYEFLPDDQAKTVCKRRKNQCFYTDIFSPSFIKRLWNQTFDGVDPYTNSLAQELDDIKYLIDAGKVSLGRLFVSIQVEGKTAEQVENKCNQVLSALAKCGCVGINETLIAFPALISSLPGHPQKTPCDHLALTSTASDMLYVSTPPHSKENIPLWTATASGNQPLAISAGSYGLINWAGTDPKKIPIRFLRASQNRRSPMAFVLAPDKSLEGLKNEKSFNYHRIENGSFQIQALRDIDSPLIAQRAVGWITRIARPEEQATGKRKMETSIVNALNSLATLPKQMRTLSGFYDMIMDNTIKESLIPLIDPAQYGSIFDANQESCEFTGVNVFEFSGIMDRNPFISAIMLEYLMSRITEAVKDTTVVIVHTPSKFLELPQMEKPFKAWAHELHGKGIDLIMSYSGLEEAVSCPLYTLTTSRIFTAMPAVRSHEKDLLKNLGLSDRQVEIIGSAMPNQDYFLSSDHVNRLFWLGD